MSFSQFYPLQRHPSTGEPYLRLPEPFDRIIITPPRREDVPHIVAILNAEAVKRWLDGLAFPYLECHGEDWVAQTKEKSDMVMHELRVAEEEQPRGPLAAVSGCPVSCLRGVIDDGTDVYLGAIEFSRCNFPDVRDRAEKERLVARNESRRRGDPHIVWCVGYYLTVPLHGQGIMSCALSTLMRLWAVPRMGARIMRAETIIGNRGSRRVLEKLGFGICDTVRVQKVTSAGELIEGFHVLWWQQREEGGDSAGVSEL
ncbi:hypothetical protein TRAPUB_13378 [Trametes pubescens]|uniref:N-acetyltransferase domain-containing protein n=1 Tax=Trametes pubescens TaxID=154538 RepID=A0A1M2W7W9_TRAPU|nr:hypothetical protein TRAPUB_13378 [Trametes pubescens]